MTFMRPAFRQYVSGVVSLNICVVFSSESEMIDGVDEIADIVDCLLSVSIMRKHVDVTWVFGGVQRGPNNCFLIFLREISHSFKC